MKSSLTVAEPGRAVPRPRLQESPALEFELTSGQLSQQSFQQETCHIL
jgi:hypothetical protein